MKKLYTLLLLTVSSLAMAQTFYSENVGVPTGTTLIPAYVAGTAPATFQNSSPILYSGTADVRATTVSTGYTGASGGGNVFITNNTDRFFLIEGINTSAYNSANLELSFGHYKSTAGATTELAVEVSTNGTDYTPLTYTRSGGATWALVTIGGGQIPSTTNLRIRFSQTSSTIQFRLDDITLSNVSASCTLELGTLTALCDASTLALDPYTVSIPFTGGGNATYTVSTTAGTVGGNNPSTSANGTITISGVTENTNITVTITGGTCNLSRNITSPACKPVNTLPYVESFDYAVGSALGAQQRWTNLNSGDEVTTVSGSLTYPGVPTAGNSVSFSGAGIDPHTPFTTVSTGTLFAAMLFNVTDMTNVTTEGASTYFASLTEETRTNFRARLFVRKADTQYQIGFDNASTTTNYDPTLRNVGDVVLVIMGYDFGTNLLKCWINPNLSTFNASTPATLTSTPAEGPATTIANLGGFILRQDGGANTPTIQFDELRISTTLEQLLSVRSNEIAGLQVYPNPVSNGVLYINTELNTTKSVQIFDLLGKQVLATTTETNAVNVSALTKGLYIVKITEEGKTATRKIVVE